MNAPPIVRRATPGDARQVAELLDEFNRSYDDFTPGVEVLTERTARMIAAKEILVFLADTDGIAQMQFRPSVWAHRPDAYLAELYVRPHRRGEGLGRALLEAAIRAAREAGAEIIDLNTSDSDEEAVSLYESAGFTNLEGGPEGSPMRYYELDLKP